MNSKFFICFVKWLRSAWKQVNTFGLDRLLRCDVWELKSIDLKCIVHNNMRVTNCQNLFDVDNLYTVSDEFFFINNMMIEISVMEVNISDMFFLAIKFDVAYFTISWAQQVFSMRTIKVMPFLLKVNFKVNRLARLCFEFYFIVIYIKFVNCQIPRC